MKESVKNRHHVREREREKDKGKVKWMGEGRLNQTVGGQRSLRQIMEDRDEEIE